MVEKKAPLHVVDEPNEEVAAPVNIDNPPASSIEEIPQAKAEPIIPPETEEALDEDELEYQRLRCDLPGVQGAAAQGIVTIAVKKRPPDNEYFRTHPTFRMQVNLVSADVGMEKQFFAVDPCMEVPLYSIGIKYAKYTLYLTTTSGGTITVVPIMNATDNEYTRTREIGLLDGVKRWVRLYTDPANSCYRVYPAPADRYDDPTWPQLRESKIFRLCFRDKGRLLYDTEHEYFKKWAASDTNKK